MTNTVQTPPTRSELLQKLRVVQADLAKTRRRCDTDAIAYASTPDGAAETFRRYELAPDEHTRKQLKTTYLAGLSMAADEHEERRRLGNATDKDGPLAVIPVGSFRDPVAKVLVEHRIMATFRVTTNAAHTGQATVTLLRLLPDQTRQRLRLRIPAELGVLTDSLSTILTRASKDPATQQRLRRFLGDPAADALATARTQREADQ